MLRIVLVALLATVGFAVVASGAGASAPAVSKVCKTYDKLNEELAKIDPSDKSGFDAGQLKATGRAFHKAARKAPGKLESAMNAIGDVYDSIGKAKNEVGAVTAFTKNAKKWSKAITTWSTYFSTNCLPTS